MRMAVSEEPEQCPHCSGPALCVILGKGGTRRPMPFFQPEDNFLMNPVERDALKHRNRYGA
jgi:hypothetical protein